MKVNDEKQLSKQWDDAAMASTGKVGKKALAKLASDLPEGTRQILNVQRYILYAGSAQVSAANPKVIAETVIKGEGKPTPSSEVEIGYIRFVQASDLRRPTYSKKRKRIDMYVDFRALPMVLKQLEQTNRYLWIGHFKGGHIYSDLHSWG